MADDIFDDLTTIAQQMSDKNNHYFVAEIDFKPHKGPILSMPSEPTLEDDKIYNLVNLPKYSKLNILNLYCCGDIDCAILHPTSISRWGYQTFNEIKGFLDRSLKSLEDYLSSNSS